MKRNLTIVALISLVVLTIILSLANRQLVVVNYLFGQFRLPLILVIAGSVLAGLLMQFLIGFTKQVGLKNQIKGLKKQLADATAPRLESEDKI